ncbi:MAG: hypothetical protein ACODAB_02240, partial [Gemmatimonadota bacterium]
SSTPEYLKMEFQRVPHRGLAAAPERGWPLDGLFVGVATLRTTRQLLRRTGALRGGSVRAWDIALWSGVTPQGTRSCMERLERIGLVREVARGKSWHAATYRLAEHHPLVEPLLTLFRAELTIAGPMRGISESGRFAALRRRRATLKG